MDRQKQNKFQITFYKASLIFFFIVGFGNFGNMPFRQIASIPMDSNPAPFYIIMKINTSV